MCACWIQLIILAETKKPHKMLNPSMRIFVGGLVSLYVAAIIGCVYLDWVLTEVTVLLSGVLILFLFPPMRVGGRSGESADVSVKLGGTPLFLRYGSLLLAGLGGWFGSYILISIGILAVPLFYYFRRVRFESRFQK
jgi:hypothetical protein